MRSAHRNVSRLLSIILVMIQIAGCHSMRTIEESPESVRSGIVDGSLLEKGDWVRLYLASGESIYFQFDRVSNDRIIGHQHAKLEGYQEDDMTTQWTEVAVPISEVERVERAHISAGKTAAGIGIPAVLLILLTVAIATAGPFMP